MGVPCNGPMNAFVLGDTACHGRSFALGCVCIVVWEVDSTHGRGALQKVRLCSVILIVECVLLTKTVNHIIAFHMSWLAHMHQCASLQWGVRVMVVLHTASRRARSEFVDTTSTSPPSVLNSSASTPASPNPSKDSLRDRYESRLAR